MERDLVDCQILNQLETTWRANYHQRALLVRLLRDKEDKKYAQEMQMRKVKFFTRKPGSHGITEEAFDCINLKTYSLEEFYDYLNLHLKPFKQSEITTVKYWRDIVSCIELIDYRYQSMPEERRVEFWSANRSPEDDNQLKEAYEKLSSEQKNVVDAFVIAFETDMIEGQAKNLINCLLRTIKKCMEGEPSFLSFSPSKKSDSTNTVLETIFDDFNSSMSELQFESPYSNQFKISSPLASSSFESKEYKSGGPTEASRDRTRNKSSTRLTVVPDYCVALRGFPGIFPLVFETQPANQETGALYQNIEQMLSKLFFQDVVFGIIVSPKSFQFSVIIKKERCLFFSSTVPINFYAVDDTLNVNRIDVLFNFIYQVLKWAGNTKCLLSNKNK